MDGPIRQRRIRFKSTTRKSSAKKEQPEIKDEFADFNYDDLDISSDSSSDDENKSLSFPGSQTYIRNATVCQEIYVKSCRHFEIIPSTYFFRRLKRSHIDLSHHGLGNDGVKPVAIALVSNTSVQKLDISSNDIKSDGLNHILQTLQENIVITDLNLSCNCLSSEGAVLLSNALINNNTIVKLDISANGFVEKDAGPIGKIITNNQCIQSLSIAKNGFREEGGVLISQALEFNRKLKFIDLSWNHLRQRGAVAICSCLQKNTTLESINLAWNGFGMEGCHEMGKALLRNRTLLELDLSSNRVSLDAFRQLLIGIGKNKTLKILRIGLNPLTTDGAVAVMQSIYLSESSLNEVDMTDVSVDDSFVDLLAEIREHRPDLRVIHGIVLRHDEITKGTKKSVLDTDDPLTILFEYMKQKNLRLIDLLHNLDRDHSDTLTRDEFQRGMTSIDLPLSSRALDLLMKKLDINQDGQVDYEELVVKHKEYQRRVTKMKMQARDGAKFFKGFDKREQLREAVRLRIAIGSTTDVQK